MRSDAQKTINRYIYLYKSLYDREPKDVRFLNADFLIVNNTQIRLDDLEQLNQQLEREYEVKRQKERATRSAIHRLINFFRSA